MSKNAFESSDSARHAKPLRHAQSAHLDQPLQLELGGQLAGVTVAYETYGDLKQAVDCLEPREKAIIYFRFFKDMSQTEVAKRLNISQMHVSRLQQKALKRLKELLSA